MPGAAAAIIPAAIGAGSSIFGGMKGANAASQAAKIQSQAAQAQAGDFKTIMQQYLPQIATTGTAAAQGVTDATTAGQTGINTAVGTGQAGLGTAVQSAQGLLQPYIGAGSDAVTNLQQLMQPGGALNKTFTAADMQQYDPGYAFRMQQASKALQGSAAARGGALGGGTASALAGLNQNLASSEFANASQRFYAGQQQRYNMLSGVAGMGQQAAGQAGQYGMTGAQLAASLGLTGATSAAQLGQQGATQAGQFTTNAAQQQAQDAFNYQQAIANLMTGGAAAQAGGVMGAANAWSGALGGVANAAGGIGNYYQQQNLLNWLKANPGVLGGGGRGTPV